MPNAINSRIAFIPSLNRWGLAELHNVKPLNDYIYKSTLCSNLPPENAMILPMIHLDKRITKKNFRDILVEDIFHDLFKNKSIPLDSPTNSLAIAIPQGEIEEISETEQSDRNNNHHPPSDPLRNTILSSLKKKFPRSRISTYSESWCLAKFAGAMQEKYPAEKSSALVPRYLIVDIGGYSIDITLVRQSDTATQQNNQFVIGGPKILRKLGVDDFQKKIGAESRIDPNSEQFHDGMRRIFYSEDRIYSGRTSDSGSLDKFKYQYDAYNNAFAELRRDSELILKGGSPAVRSSLAKQLLFALGSISRSDLQSNSAETILVITGGGSWFHSIHYLVEVAARFSFNSPNMDVISFARKSLLEQEANFDPRFAVSWGLRRAAADRAAADRAKDKNRVDDLTLKITTVDFGSKFIKIIGSEEPMSPFLDILPPQRRHELIQKNIDKNNEHRARAQKIKGMGAVEETVMTAEFNPVDVGVRRGNPSESEQATDVGPDASDGFYAWPKLSVSTNERINDFFVGLWKGKDCSEIDRNILTHLYACHGHRAMLLLLGNPGTGKSHALRSMTNFDGIVVHAIPVRSSWEAPESLLGYLNPIKPDQYIPEPFLDAIHAAHRDYNEFMSDKSESKSYKIHLVILEEINSAPDRYLIDLMHLMNPDREVNSSLKGQSDSVDANIRLYSALLRPRPEIVPPAIELPPNMIIAGTMNWDRARANISQALLSRSYLWTVSGNIEEQLAPEIKSYQNKIYDSEMATYPWISDHRTRKLQENFKKACDLAMFALRKDGEAPDSEENNIVAQNSKRFADYVRSRSIRYLDGECPILKSKNGREKLRILQGLPDGEIGEFTAAAIRFQAMCGMRASLESVDDIMPE